VKQEQIEKGCLGIASQEDTCMWHGILVI
jgi:hypothetical protein